MERRRPSVVEEVTSDQDYRTFSHLDAGAGGGGGEPILGITVISAARHLFTFTLAIPFRPHLSQN